MEQVILVDEQDCEIGTAEKVSAHRGGGRLHRAFSIFIFNDRGELLLQRRAAGKYHFAGLWSNTCCGHPRPGEATGVAGRRRLGEEFGFDADLREVASFIYRADDSASDLTEHEYLHLLVGHYDGPVTPDPAEIENWRWAAPAEIQRDLAARPAHYTPWFGGALSRVLETP
ncbi:MAG: isopentenyl-diphosphate Delta-isomerase [Phycisphaerae bacterium]